MKFGGGEEEKEDKEKLRKLIFGRAQSEEEEDEEEDWKAKKREGKQQSCSRENSRRSHEIKKMRTLGQILPVLQTQSLCIWMRPLALQRFFFPMEGLTKFFASKLGGGGEGERHMHIFRGWREEGKIRREGEEKEGGGGKEGGRDAFFF